MAIDFTFPPVREVIRNFLPAFVSRGVVQISITIDTQIASLMRTVSNIDLEMGRIKRQLARAGRLPPAPFSGGRRKVPNSKQPRNEAYKSNKQA